MNPILVEIKQDRPGFDHFFGSWVCMGDINIVVDAGPSNSVNYLIESLMDMNMDRLDFILLTHLHIDHAGGIAELLNHFPMARVVCHGNGVRHLVDPSKLWAGSLKVLGEIAEFYGPLEPVEREKIIPHAEAHIKDLEIIETPGHAPHHLSFCYQGNLFAGEAGGNYLMIRGQEYLRPATPPIFFLGECLKSVDILFALEDQPIYYAHFGKGENSHRLLKRFRDQLLRWDGIIKNEISVMDLTAAEAYVDRILEKDPDLKAYGVMDPDVQKRERLFMTNSVRGYLGFLENN